MFDPLYTAEEMRAARGKLVSPGFINTHVHTSGPGGDYLLEIQGSNHHGVWNKAGVRLALRA